MRIGSSKFRLLLLAAASLLCPGAGGAVEGVIEINQARALAGGVTPGDRPGFPVTLSTPGSYRLTSNLNVGNDPNLSAIEISADRLNLDLNGFVVAGPVTCTGFPPTLACSPSGTGKGISPSPTSGIIIHVEVRNGTVRGFAGGGVVPHVGLQIDHLFVTSNGGQGISSGPSIVEDSIVIQNGGYGISVGTGSLIQRCIVIGNTLGGIRAESGTIVGNVASANGGNGIEVSLQSVIQDNAVNFNQSDGVAVLEGTLVTHSAAIGNSIDGIHVGSGGLASDNVASSNSGSGITADSGSSVQRNTTSMNGVDGLRLVPSSGPAAGYRENVSSGNTAKQVEGGVPMSGASDPATDPGANSCNGTTTCP